MWPGPVDDGDRDQRNAAANGLLGRVDQWDKLVCRGGVHRGAAEGVGVGQERGAAV